MENKQMQKREGIKFTGIQRITIATLETPEQWAIHNEIEERKKSNKEYINLVRELNSKCKTKVFETKNLIPTVGRAIIVDNLVNSTPTNNSKINYSALGTGLTAPANSNTQLIAEVYRRTIASGSQANNIGYISAFYSATEVTGTFYEHGLFCNGSATANSGVLFSRILINSGNGIVKTTAQTLTVDYLLTLL